MISGLQGAHQTWRVTSNVPEYMVRGGVTYRVLSDHLGSPRALVDVASGAVAWRADFDAWGKRTLIAGTADFLPFGFAGGMLDAETGLTRFGARDYDPTVGRWTAKDPIRWEGDGTGFYAYSAGDPINSADRSGTLTCPEKGKQTIVPWTLACMLFGCEWAVADPQLWASCLVGCAIGGVVLYKKQLKCEEEECSGKYPPLYCYDRCDEFPDLPYCKKLLNPEQVACEFETDSTSE